MAINQQDLQASFQRSQIINSAREMLSRGAPMESVVQATGLDRQTIENIYMKDAVMGAPDNPMPNPVAPAINLTQDVANAGIMGNASDNPDTQRIIQGMNDGEGEGADIKEFLDLSLGANKGDNDDLTPDQAVTSGGLAGAMNDETSFMSYLEGSSMLEGLADPEKMQIYKQAAANMVGEMNYDEFIQQPDKVMPYLAAGLSLINSGEKGEDWGAALGKAFISGYGSKRKEEKEYDKTIAGLELKKQGDINNIVSSMMLTDMKDRMAFNKSLKLADLKAPKMYDIVGASGTFSDKETLPLSDMDFNRMGKAFPGSIRPATNSELKPFTVLSDSGRNMNVFLNQDQLGFYQSNPKYAGQIRAGHDERTNMKLYSVKNGEETTENWLTPKEFENLPEGQVATILPTSGSPVYVSDKVTGLTNFVSPMELARNGAKYDKISSFTGTMTSTDGTIIEFGNGNDGSRAVENRGLKQFESVNNKLLGIDRAVDNYFISADQMDKSINEYITEFPEQADLAFNNLAGRATKLADNIVISVKGFGAMLNAAPKDGGGTFYIGDTKVGYDSYKENIINSSEFETFRNSAFAGFLEQSGITGARLDAALFDMAMIGAASYSVDGTLDLRAISDFETKQFMRLQGAEASSLAQFQAITNDFRLKLVNRNINEIERTLDPANLFQIKDKYGKTDIESIDILKESGQGKLNKLLKRKEELENTDTSQRPAGNKTFVFDPSIDPDNPDVIEFKTITANPESNFGQKYGLSVPLTTETETELEGTFRQMLNKYSSLKANIQQQDEYVEQLQKTLRPEEFAFFQAHIVRARTLGL